jgi:hypothetical protein
LAGLRFVVQLSRSVAFWSQGGWVAVLRTLPDDRELVAKGAAETHQEVVT